MKISEIYNESGIMYIRFDADVDIKPNGQKKIGGKRNSVAFSKLEKQPENQKGKYYSLLMGREYKPGKFAVLLDFDNKADETNKSGLELMAKLNMDQYKAPKQMTPSGGFHYIFWVDEEQKEHIGSPTGIVYKNEKYAMDVKFKNGLCNCAPGKIEGYGEYKWVNPSKLLDIPQLPKELFELIRKKAAPKQVTTTLPKAPTSETKKPCKATENELQDMKALCSCLSITQLDDYATWRKLGMVLKRLGAPMILWEVMSKRSKKFKPNDCSSNWASLPTEYGSIIALLAMAKEGNLDTYQRMRPRLHMNMDVLEDMSYPSIEINTPFLTTKTPEAQETNKDQGKFRQIVDSFMTDDAKKSLGPEEQVRFRQDHLHAEAN